MSDLREKLQTEVDQCDWSMLRPHHNRGAVFLLEDPVSLLDAAVAVATDDAEKVKKWQQNNIIRQPNNDETESWEKNDLRKFADFIIIQPYVLIKLKPLS